jgi:hypothetical protein
MNKKNMLIGAGVLVAIYLVTKRKTVLNVSVNEESPKEELSDKDKNTLFTATLGYRGGARPTQSILNKSKENVAEALAKVKFLGLEAELSTWKKENYSRAKPLIPMMKGGDTFKGGNFGMGMSRMEQAV